MPHRLPPSRKSPKVPPGYLTRQQAAALLGFSSEFKVRQLERDGRLRALRGAMRTAFYPRGEVLEVKAELGKDGRGCDDDWTDSELLALLERPHREGRARSAMDLVLETHVSIDRAEKVFAFWASSRISATTARPQPGHAEDTATGVVAKAALPGQPGAQERRAGQRLSRDALIAELRHPDPRVRNRAFALLKQG